MNHGVHISDLLKSILSILKLGGVVKQKDRAFRPGLTRYNLPWVSPTTEDATPTKDRYEELAGDAGDYCLTTAYSLGLVQI